MGSVRDGNSYKRLNAQSSSVNFKTKLRTERSMQMIKPITLTS